MPIWRVLRSRVTLGAAELGFNLDPDRFPIYDSYAREMLRYHLGRENWTWDWGQPYQSFCTLYRRLGELAGLRVSNRALDRYLWLGGQRRHWLRNPDAPVSSEVRIAFRNPELAGDLERLGSNVCANPERGHVIIENGATPSVAGG
jgi:hypothetical protein